MAFRKNPWETNSALATYANPSSGATVSSGEPLAQTHVEGFSKNPIPGSSWQSAISKYPTLPWGASGNALYTGSFGAKYTNPYALGVTQHFLDTYSPEIGLTARPGYSQGRPFTAEHPTFGQAMSYITTILDDYRKDNPDKRINISPGGGSVLTGYSK